MRKLSYVSLLIMVFIFLATATGLPVLFDSESPAAVNVSPRYIEKSHEETGSLNFVTAVLADYRGYDTLGETTVIFTAGVAVVLLLRAGKKNGNDSEVDGE